MHVDVIGHSSLCVFYSMLPSRTPILSEVASTIQMVEQAPFRGIM